MNKKKVKITMKWETRYEYHIWGFQGGFCVFCDATPCSLVHLRGSWRWKEHILPSMALSWGRRKKMLLFNYPWPHMPVTLQQPLKESLLSDPKLNSKLEDCRCSQELLLAYKPYICQPVLFRGGQQWPFFFFLILVCEAIGTDATPGLLSQLRVIAKMIVE
jgi:hypothetical protein